MQIHEILELITNPVKMVEEGKVYLMLIPVYVGLISGERFWYALKKPGKWDDLDSVANVSITMAVLILEMIIGFLLPLAVLIFLYEFRLFTIPMVWWGWVLVFLLHDLTWYIDHYLGHRVGLFWAIHSVHHSSKEYNTTVASRGFLLDNHVTRPLFYLLPILGVSPVQYILVRVITSIWGIIQHTRLVGRLPLLDRVLATPSNHRVHHGADVEYLDANYGEVLIIWDRLFGTYVPEQQEPKYGLTKNIETYNPLLIEVAGIRWLWEQVKSADNWRDKMAYLWQPPGWRHDGAGETTQELRSGLLKTNKTVTYAEKNMPSQLV